MALWNCIHTVHSNLVNSSPSYDGTDRVLMIVWRDFFEADLRAFNRTSAMNDLSDWILREEWHEALSAIESYTQALDAVYASFGEELATKLNDQVLERFLVGYRFIGLTLTPIASSEDAQAVNSALENESIAPSAREHISKAVSLLSSRDKPNYRKSIAESIDAVEAAVYDMTGKKTLSSGLKALNRSGSSVHPALVAAWDKMYAWSGDDGIRHAEFDSLQKDQATAVYMLVTCSAFVNYLASAKDISAVKE